MKAQAHHFVFRHLMADVSEVNERIEAGDICSNKTALPRCRKLCDLYADAYDRAGCREVRLEPYLAAGGWIGIMYSYDAPGDGQVSGSMIPRSFLN